MKKIVVVDPYLDVLGGGEKHILSIAQVFEESGYAVDLLWPDPQILTKLQQQLNIKLNKIQIVPLAKTSLSRLMQTKQYEYLFYVTDGSYFFSLARHNYIFAMYPQASLYRPTALNRLKWSKWDFIANSPFTKSFVDRWTGRKSEVIYPYIDIFPFTESQISKKAKIILTVGRFFKHLHAKRQDIVIKAFQQLQHRYQLFKEFKLYLIGGLKEEDKAYFSKLQILAAENENIIFLPNASHDIVNQYYQKALFYWHAAGYEVDESQHPEAVEHLGLAPMEAMAAGCVTFCHASGGPKKLIVSGANGFLYKTIDELIDQTGSIYGKKDKMEIVSHKSHNYIKDNFSYETFQKMIVAHFNNICYNITYGRH